MSEETDIREILRRCSKETIEASITYQKSKDSTLLPTIVLGIIERYLESDYKVILKRGGDDIRLMEDLGIDSIVMIEIVMNIEEVLGFSVPNEELRDLRTLRDLKLYLKCKTEGLPIPTRKRLETDAICEILPHRDPFLFLYDAEIYGKSAIGRYPITGNEFFLKGHFKNQPVFPASIMLESLGQLAVLLLLKGENLGLLKPVNNKRILFATCNGVRCTRLCKPNDVLQLKIELKKLHAPLAVFRGSAYCGKEKVIYAEEITLAFEYKTENNLIPSKTKVIIEDSKKTQIPLKVVKETSNK